MPLTDVLLLLLVIANSSDEIIGRRSDLLVQALPAIVKADWKGGLCLWLGWQGEHWN